MCLTSTGQTTCPAKRKFFQQAKSQDRGIGLVEVLVALFVLSIGFLVSANMQLRGMQSSLAIYHDSQALMLANEMMDRMRNNREGVLAGEYDDKTTSSSITLPACASSGCEAAGLARVDLFEWSANLHSLRNEPAFIPVLPPADDGTAASASVSDPDSDGIYTITIQWTRFSNGQSVDETLSLDFLP